MKPLYFLLIAIMTISLVGCTNAAKETDCLKYFQVLSEIIRDDTKLPSVTGMSIKQKQIAATKYLLEAETKQYKTFQGLTLELPESQKLLQKQLELKQKYINSLQKKVGVLASVPDQSSAAEIDKITAPVKAEVSTAFDAQANFDFALYCKNTKVGSQKEK